jgi:hypothetical protein
MYVQLWTGKTNIWNVDVNVNNPYLQLVVRRSSGAHAEFGDKTKQSLEYLVRINY